MREKKPPSHTCYALKREGRTSGRWLEIGVATMHDDGKGLNVLLDRLPVGGFTGHLTIRVNEDGPPELPMPSTLPTDGAA